MIALAEPDSAPLASAPDAMFPGRAVVQGRHPEYREFVTTWRWLLDSLEGGERYRDADYGTESYVVTWDEQDRETGRSSQQYRHHNLPRRNLIRHPQEYPTASTLGDPLVEGAPSTGDEYEFRRALTPVPSFVPEAINAHLSRIYAREVRREAPAGPAGDALRAWWADVDGAGTAIDDWMQETIAPTFLVLGQLDLAFDHPPAPAGETIESQADVERLDLTRVVASYILPENLTDWKLGPDRCYEWAVVREWSDAGKERYRKWTATESTLYDDRGRVLVVTPHRYRRVPIGRNFDTRKIRLDNVGQPRYGVIAEIQRTYYNVDSELTLSNSLAAHALLSGPEEYCSGSSVAVGPGNVLPMKRVQGAAGGTAYQGWNYVCPPNDAADKLRHKLDDLRDAADRAACLSKPAGTHGVGKGTVGQSGVSKMLDQSSGNDLLSKVSKALRQLELRAAALFLTVYNGGPPDPAFLAKVTVAYPTKFDLFTATDFSTLMAEWQALVQGVDGELPEMAGHLFRTWVRLVLSGLDDDTYKVIDGEIEAFLAAKKAEADRRAEAGPTVPGPGTAAPGDAQQPWPYARGGMLSEEVPTGV